MLRKIVNYLMITFLTLGLIIPATASAAVSISATALNYTNGEKVWVAQANAKPGDSVSFNIKFTNTNAVPANGLLVRAILPSELSYVGGSARMYYRESGVDKSIAVTDAIASASGASIPSVPANNFVYITYRTNVKSGTSGIHAPSNQIIGNGVSLSSNAATVNIVATNPATTTATPTAPATTVTGTNSGTKVATASLISSVRNVTKGDTFYSTAVNANRGDEVIYRITLTNNGDAPATGLQVRAVLSPALEYVSNYAKFYYKDTDGIDKQITVSDAIVTTGVAIPDVPAHRFVYLTYKTRVSSTASAGTHASANQAIGNNGISLNDNSGVVTVAVAGQTPVNLPAASLISSVRNVTKGDTFYSTAVNANRGDEVIYRITLTNNGDAPATGLQVRAVLSPALEYVSNYAKFYYKDTDGIDKQITVSDAIVTTGVAIPDVPAHRFVYLTYKTRVSSTASAGTHASANQAIGNNGISLNDNSGVVTVFEDGITPPPVPETRNLALTAGAKVGNAADYSAVVSANRGDTVKMRINFSNIGNTDLKNVRISNSLPSNLEYVKGTMKVVVGGATISTADNVLTNGISLGDFSMGANGYMEFSTKVKSSTPASVSQLVYTSNGSADGISPVSSMVTISLAAIATGKGTTTLPDTGLPTAIIAVVLLAVLLSTAGYIYTKEKNSLNAALKVVKS